jgi:hypothetical protein
VALEGMVEQEKRVAILAATAALVVVLAVTVEEVLEAGVKAGGTV